MCKLKEVLKSEANEYFEYNEKSKGVLFFMLDINDFDSTVTRHEKTVWSNHTNLSVPKKVAWISIKPCDLLYNKG